MRKITSMQKIRQFAKQKGAFLLLEMSAVSIIASMAVATALIQQKNALQTERYQAQGELLKTLSASIDSYLASNYDALTRNSNATTNAAGTVVSGSVFGPNGNSTTTYAVSNIYAPTVAELITAGFLPSGFSSTALVYASDNTKPEYKIKITPSPAANCPNCNLQGLVYLNKAVKTDEIKNLGTSIAAIGANGLYSVETNADAGTSSAILYARENSKQIDNPVSGTPAGILAASNDYSTSGLKNFMRIDGLATPTADQNWNAKNLTNVGSLTAGTGSYTGDNTWTGSGVSIDSSGNIHASGTIYGTIANSGSNISLDLKPVSGLVRTNDNFLKAGAIVVSDNLSATPGSVGSITASSYITGGSLYTGSSSAIDTTPSGIGASLKSDGSIYASSTITGGSFFTTGTSGTNAFSTTNGNIVTTNGNIYTGSSNTIAASPSGTGVGLKSTGSIYASGAIKGASLDASGGGISNAGAISGATTIDATGNFKTTAAIAVGTSTAGSAGTITASGKITAGGGLDANNAGIGNTGAITGATTIVASGEIKGSAFTGSNSSINSNGQILGTSLYVGSSGAQATTNGTTTTGVGLSSTGTMSVGAAGSSSTNMFTVNKITSGVQTAVVAIKNLASSVSDAILTVLGTIQATGGDLIAKVSGGVGGNVTAEGNVSAAGNLQITSLSGTNSSSTSTTTSATTTGGWFLAADNWLTSLNGKGIYTAGGIKTPGTLEAGAVAVGSSGLTVYGGPIRVRNAADTTTLASIDASGNITGTSLNTGSGTIQTTGTISGGTISGTSFTTSGNITSSGGYLKGGSTVGGVTVTRDTGCTTAGAIATDANWGTVTCQAKPSGALFWQDSTIKIYSNTNVTDYVSAVGPYTVNYKVQRSLSNTGVDCPNGFVMTGVQSTGTSGSNITKIRCSPIYQGSALIPTS